MKTARPRKLKGIPVTFTSRSIEDTMKAGAELAKRLRPGDIVALVGDLGAGKTVFTKGIAKGLGVKDVRYVNSPTFVLIKEYKGKIPLYHFDLYRLNHPSMIDSENYDEYFYGKGVCVVEWADKIRSYLPDGCVEVKITSFDGSKRKIRIK